MPLTLKESDVECSRNQNRTRVYVCGSCHLPGNSKLTHLIDDPRGIVARLTASDATIKEITHRLFFYTLFHEPTEAEWNAIHKHFENIEPPEYVEDVFRALANTQDFAWGK